MSTPPDESPNPPEARDVEPGGLGPIHTPLTGHQRLMLVLLGLTLAATCFLISAPRRVEEGHQPWKPGSALRVLTTLMTLNFEYPTTHGVEIKWLAQAGGAAAAVLLAGLAAGGVNRRNENWSLPPQHAPATTGIAPINQRCSPATIAQGALLLFAIWNMLSATWAPWPEAAFLEGCNQLIVTLWAIALGRTLTARTLAPAAIIFVGVLALAAIFGIWYHAERNPVQRLKFPIGNPIFMAACLLPGITLAAAGLIGTVNEWLSPPRRSSPTETPAFAAASQSRKNTSHVVWLAIGSLTALIVCWWAFKLTDSRGPDVGLGVGTLLAVCCLATGRSRRGLLIATLLALVMAAIYLQVWGWPGFITRRMDTVLLRFHAWSYALTIFLEHPLLGAGKAAYLLQAQAMSRAQAEVDPVVFPSELLGRAHNHWLEILAELGVVGFALMAICLIATLWCAVGYVRRSRGRWDLWIGWGLLAGFLGIIASESTDVALSKPGLPVIFYAIMGLLWAGAREEPKDSRGWFQGRTGHKLVVAGCAVLAAGIVSVAARDWQGALASEAIKTQADKLQWNKALELADYARHRRLTVEAALLAENEGNLAASRAAALCWQRFRQMMERHAETGALPVHVIELAREDLEVFDRYANWCQASTARVLERIPCYPFVARRAAEILLMRQDMEQMAASVGLIQQPRTYAERARLLILAEYECDRRNPYVALQLFELSTEQPVAERFDYLRLALRSGPGPFTPPGGENPAVPGRLRLDLYGQYDTALASLMQEEEYPALAEERLGQALAALSLIDADQWPDFYLPETLRLMARDRRIRGQFDQAFRLAVDAAAASEKIADRFFAAVSLALADAAEYALLADPQHPERAVEICKEAIRRWPTRGNAWQAIGLHRTLVHYLLAAGDEEAARQAFVNLTAGQLPDEIMDRVIGIGLLEVCQILLASHELGNRPAWLPERLQRALQLMPNSPDAHLIAATVALEANDGPAATSHLRTLEQYTDDPARLAVALQSLLRHFGDRPALQEFVRDWQARHPAATQPAPTTQETPLSLDVAPLPPPDTSSSPHFGGPENIGIADEH